MCYITRLSLYAIWGICVPPLFSCALTDLPGGNLYIADQHRAHELRIDKADDLHAGVAQLVEQLICNQPVTRSSRVVGFLSRRGARVAKGNRL